MQKISQSSVGQTGMLRVSERGFGGGGHEIVKAGGDHKFIAPVDKKMVAFSNLKGTTP